MKKAHTATEYLIILAVVIVIALIVVGVLGGITGIGGGANENTARKGDRATQRLLVRETPSTALRFAECRGPHPPRILGAELAIMHRLRDPWPVQVVVQTF